MKLIEIEPYSWELYQDDQGMYLEVKIHKGAVTWEQSFCLDQNSIQDYLNQGKAAIHALERRIESSKIRKDYERFYSFTDVTFLQKQKMREAFRAWKNANLN